MTQAETKSSKRWAYIVGAFALGCVLFLGGTIVDTENELQEVKEPVASECVRNGYVFNALRQVCTEIVDGETPRTQVPVMPPQQPVERFPSAQATPVPTVPQRPGGAISVPLPGGALPRLAAPSTVTLAAPPPAGSPPVTVTGAAPPPVTVTEPAPPPATETVTVTGEPPPPSTVTETAEPPPPVTETTTVTETETVTETAEPTILPPIIN